MATCDRTLDLSAGQLTVYPGKVEAFLTYDRERRLHAERTNATVLARRRQLEDFIARNKARASTASRARSKSRQLERLELEEVASTEPTAAIRCPAVSPRRGPAVRCRGLSIGHGDRVVAAEIDVEVVHGARAAIVGDNGQGKTTFLRTLVASLEPLAGEVRWGHGCALGVYAQHVYTSLPADETVLGYLERGAAIGTPSQRILDLAGAMLFRGRAVEKRISVLSGGERARLCLAGLLLGSANVLVLDEPGNHLDVETVDALAAALVDYAGTVIFTSHDRSFVQAVASDVIEVGGGRVRLHGGGYADYLAALGREADAVDAAAGRDRAGRDGGTRAADRRDEPRPRNDRDLRKELSNLEKKVATLDAEKRRLDAALLVETDPAKAISLHEAVVKAAAELAAAEERWLAVSEALGGA
jgi:ATP-binding cassette subfamily F protein 3